MFWLLWFSVRFVELGWPGAFVCSADICANVKPSVSCVTASFLDRLGEVNSLVGQ